MAYDVRLDDDNRIVHIEVIGSIDLESATKYSREAFDLAADSDYQKIMFDCTQATIVEFGSGVIQHANELEGLGFKDHFKAASVHSPDDMDSAKLLEQTAQKKGHDLKIFTDHQSAIDWLKKD